MEVMPNQRTVDRVARYQSLHTKIKAQLEAHDQKWQENVNG